MSRYCIFAAYYDALVRKTPGSTGIVAQYSTLEQQVQFPRGCFKMDVLMPGGVTVILLYSNGSNTMSVGERTLLKAVGLYRQRLALNVDLSELKEESWFQIVIRLSVDAKNKDDNSTDLAGFVRSVSFARGECSSNGTVL